MEENILAQKHIERQEVTLSELLAVQDLQPLGGFGKLNGKTPGDLRVGEGD